MNTPLSRQTTWNVSQRTAKKIDGLLQQPGWKAVLRQYVNQMHSGYWEQGYLDSIIQTCGAYDLYAAYCFAHLHAWIGIGKVLTAIIDLGSEPRSDKEIAANNALLAGLPEPFSGAFWGEFSDADGYVKWTSYVEFGQLDCMSREIVASIKPRSVPLEVGYTRADTTLLHILGEGGLARWPYGSEHIYLFVRNPNFPNAHPIPPPPSPADVL